MEKIEDAETVRDLETCLPAGRQFRHDMVRHDNLINANTEIQNLDPPVKPEDDSISTKPEDDNIGTDRRMTIIINRRVMTALIKTSIQI